MPVTAIVGANWGDEGKGKTTDYLAAHADIVVRFQGGDNAGHTIINDQGKFVLHLLPSGVFYPNVVNVLGPGVALNIPAFVAERQKLLDRGAPEPQLLISERAQVLLPYHLLLDAYEEERLGGRQFGSTRRGIAPFYADKYMKVGVQVADLFDGQRLRARLASALAVKNVLLEHLYHKPQLDADELAEKLWADGQRIKPYIGDAAAFLHQALHAGQQILLEGQLGALRDPDHGIYPYPTSSSTLAGFGAVGAGVPPYAIQRVVAVAKAYSSCVGAVPFVTELHGAAGGSLAPTGRRRR